MPLPNSASSADVAEPGAAFGAEQHRPLELDPDAARDGELHVTAEGALGGVGDALRVGAASSWRRSPRRRSPAAPAQLDAVEGEVGARAGRRRRRAGP